MKTALSNIFTRTVVLATLLTGGLMIYPLANAAEKAGIQVPATSEAIRQSIDKEAEQLATIIHAGKLEEVHHHAFAIRDLVAALPAHSASLPPEKLAQVKANGKFVATLAERLDATGDAKDKAGTASNFEKLETVLKSIRAIYSGAVRK